MNEYAGTVMKNINVNIHALEKIPEIQSGDDLGSIIIAVIYNQKRIQFREITLNSSPASIRTLINESP